MGYKKNYFTVCFADFKGESSKPTSQNFGMGMCN